MQMNEQPPLSQSSALSFGPEWMRPKPARSAENDQFARSQILQGAWGQVDNSFSSSAPTRSASSSKTLYSTDELLQVWSALQVKLQAQGFEEKYSSLQPIRDLVSQVERDRTFQAQNGQLNGNANGSANGKRKDVEQLTKKLTEIDSWAKKEGNGLDFASILNNVAQQQQQQKQQQTQSPFLANRSIHLQHQNSSFSNLSSPMIPPPGLHAFSQPQPLLQPDQINWYYVDPNGKEQGPFNGLEMQSWYNSNYLSPELQIRREGEFSFYLLREFTTRVGDTIQPFLISLQSLPQHQQQQTPQHQQFNPFDQQLPGLFDQSATSSTSSPFMHQSQSQLSQFQNSANAWNLGNSGRNSPWTQPVQPMNGGLGQDYMQTNFMSGVFDNVNLQQQPQAVDDELFNQIHKQMLGGVLSSETTTSTTTADVTAKAPAPVQTKAEPAVTAAPEPVSAPAPVSTPAPVPAAKQSAKPAQATTPQAKAKTAPAPKTTTAPASKTEKKSKPIKVTTTSEIKAAAQSESKPAPTAPWATQASTYTTPQMTLEQIQQLEAQEKMRQQKLRAERAAQMLANTERSLREQELLSMAKQPALPSTSSWATSNAVDTPTKTLADIQREEAEAAARAAKQAAQALAQANALHQQASVAAPSKSSFASIANSSTPAWTVVTSKKPQQKVQQQAPVIHSTMKQATPDMLRSVSASSTPVVSSSVSYTAAASSSTRGVSPRQEFLTWCRTALKLNKGVSVNDVLQIMLMLPVSQESSEIIADTVYSNSSTMDGRRFAQEFMKRRRAVEAVVHDGLSWNDALHISVTDDDDGWDFQVVKKKGKKRN